MRRCPIRLTILTLIPLLVGPLVIGSTANALAGGASQDAAGGKILRIGEGEFPPTLDPHLSVGNEVWVSYLDYEGLTRLDEEMNTVPAAAEAWEFNADATVVTFRLRENLTYADGSPLTAERFRYAIERTCDPRTEAPFADSLFDIVGCAAFHASLEADPADEAAYAAAKAELGVAALDDRTLEIRLTRPAVYFPTIAGNREFVPVQREIIERDPTGWWRDPATRIGNGPFRVVAVEPDASPPRIRFAANERYWGGGPKLDGIEYHYINDSDAELAAYRRGEIEMAWPRTSAMPAVEADPVLSRELVVFPRPMTWLFNFNLTNEPFTDKKVREAFAYGFDRAAYCRDRDFGHCAPTLSWIPPGMPGAIETDAYAFDPVKARQALAESSYGGPEGLPEIRWYYLKDEDGDRGNAEWLAGQYRQVLGVELTLVPLATHEEFDTISPIEVPAEEADWQLGSSYWFNDVPDPHGWLGFWTCGATIIAAWIGYCNPTFDALVARADAELDPATRLAIYEEAQHLLVADVPAVFLANPPNMVLVKPYVAGYSVAAASMGFPGSTSLLTLDLAPR